MALKSLQKKNNKYVNVNKYIFQILKLADKKRKGTRKSEVVFTCEEQYTAESSHPA